MKLYLILGALAGLGILFMSREVIGSDKDSYADEFDPYFLKFARQFGLSPVLVKSISANESYVGRYVGLEPKGGTTGIMHIKLSTAQMFKKDLTPSELARPEIEIEYAVKYIKWLWDRYSRFDSATRTKYTVMGYNGGPGRVDQIIKGEYKTSDSWYQNVLSYWSKYQGHVAKLTALTQTKIS